MIDPETGAWREMIDPTTRKPGRALQLTVGHADSVGEQLFAHEDADQAHVHPIKLMGDLYQTRTVLRCLEDEPQVASGYMGAAQGHGNAFAADHPLDVQPGAAVPDLGFVGVGFRHNPVGAAGGPALPLASHVAVQA